MNCHLPPQLRRDISLNKLHTKVKMPLLIHCHCTTVTQTIRDVSLHTRLTNSPPTTVTPFSLMFWYQLNQLTHFWFIWWKHQEHTRLGHSPLDVAKIDSVPLRLWRDRRISERCLYQQHSTHKRSLWSHKSYVPHDSKLRMPVYNSGIQHTSPSSSSSSLSSSSSHKYRLT